MPPRLHANVVGRLPQSLTELIPTRFDGIDVCEEADRTVLTGRVADQAQLRSLLILIWDTGSSLSSVTLKDDTDAQEP